MTNGTAHLSKMNELIAREERVRLANFVEVNKKLIEFGSKHLKEYDAADDLFTLEDPSTSTLLSFTRKGQHYVMTKDKPANTANKTGHKLRQTIHKLNNTILAVEPTKEDNEALRTAIGNMFLREIKSNVRRKLDLNRYAEFKAQFITHKRLFNSVKVPRKYQLMMRLGPVIKVTLISTRPRATV
jgi:hypothetical protein